MYKLICSDIDGTLIRDDLTISEYTKNVIREAVDKGVHVVLTTGRLFGSARVYVRQLGLNTPILACNGGVIKESATGKKLFGRPIPKDVCKDVFRIMKENDLYYHFYGEENFYCVKMHEEASEFLKFSKSLPKEDQFPIIEVEDPAEAYERDEIYKILFHAEGEEMRNRYKDMFGKMDGLYLTSSWINNFEICGPDVSKGSTVRHFAESLGISREEVFCIGDNNNDITMLEYAGMGVAMGNALDEVKSIADYVTASNNEDGVAKAIEKFVL